MTRPWLMIATRSHSRSTSPSRCELRNTAEPALARLADDRADVVAADRVERGRGLVEDHERRVAHERRREPEPLLHPLGEAAGPVAGAVGEPGEPEDAVDLGLAALGGQPAELRVQRQHLVRGQPGLVAEQLGQVADPPPRLAVADGPAEHLAGPGGRTREPEQELDGRRLAGAVGAEEAEHLAGLDAEVERVEADGPAVDLAQAVGLDGEGGHAGILRAGPESVRAARDRLGVTGRVRRCVA